MKRTKRVSILIEHLRFSISLTGLRAAEVPAATSGDEAGSKLDAGPISPLCPHCGAPWIAVTLQPPDAAAAGSDTVYRALQQRGLHVHTGPAGQLNICSKSLEQISFEETKESL
jgi:hypothetical protein